MFSKILVTILLFTSLETYASWNSAERTFSKRVSTKQMRSMIIDLVRDGYIFSALPWMKEYLTRDSKNLDIRIDSALSRIISKAGLKQFETLNINYLKRSRSDNMRYIIAKKYFRNSQYDKALVYLERINSNHEIYPFALHMRATLETLKGNEGKAMTLFDRCARESQSASLKEKKSRKLKLNRDYCILGKARAKFKERRFDESDLLYLDIPKSSAVWPEILFEEAWNSYYQKNFNRTLGKLVSYKAPVFSHMFNPEIEVLQALSYLRICYYDDAKKIVEDFYATYYKDTLDFRRYLNANRNKRNHFYNSMVRFERNGKARTKLHKRLMSSIEKEEAFLDLKKQLLSAAKEYNRIRNNRSSRFKRAVVLNIQDYILTQKKIIGAHVYGKLVSHYVTLYKAFEGMSYINLETLKQKKKALYDFNRKDRSRGDIKYIERNEKQYFWDFNGEFWADELGDYVFALKSEC